MLLKRGRMTKRLLLVTGLLLISSPTFAQNAPMPGAGLPVLILVLLITLVFWLLKRRRTPKK
jgi:hypothetical protein